MSESHVFYDSWGHAWQVCRADEDGAKAFGPAYAAKPDYDAPTHKQASVAGRIKTDDQGWDWLVETKDGGVK
jgi:hypothetical protein